jgi:nicotinamidase-related amidase
MASTRRYSQSLIDPSRVALCLIDHQPQMFFGVGSAPRERIMNSVVCIAKAAKLFNVPTILSTVAKDTFSGAIFSQIQDVFPDVTPIDRETLNAWEDENFRAAIDDIGRKELLIAGLWTEVCVALPTLCAIEDGYKVYVVTDACGGMSKLAHQSAITRVTQAGAHPVTAISAMLEMQRSWANKDTYDQIMDIVKEHGGAYGLGVEYRDFVNSEEGSYS